MTLFEQVNQERRALKIKYSICHIRQQESVMLVNDWAESDSVGRLGFQEGRVQFVNHRDMLEQEDPLKLHRSMLALLFD